MESLRPASTVIVLRAAADAPFEVLMVRRHDKVAFMAGAYVFPGGRVDEADRQGAAPATEAPSRFTDLTPVEEAAYRRAAVRELQEEAAVTLPVEALIPLAHWVTPDIEIRRYDTRFFLAVVPAGQHAQHDNHETTALAWLTPDQAIVEYRADRILLPPPTWTTLRQLARHTSLDAAVTWARTRPIVRVQPGFLKREADTLLTLPGDPLYPAIEGWEVPAETRFRLDEGRWRPVTVEPGLAPDA
ncbi:MAG: NUDIX hydrolase [Vicinamibacterales bacterium]|nr:NUDIX hydrolase [Vicinamibacterales bacterium]